MNTITELKKMLEGITQEEYEQEQKPALLDYKRSKSIAAKNKIQGLQQQLVNETRDKAKDIAVKINETRNIQEKLELIDELAELCVDMPTTRIGHLPIDIRQEIEADLEEVEKCMANNCNRSAVILCGRILETALHRKYYDVTGIDLLEKAPGTGLGNIIAKLAERGIKLDPGLTNQIHLVNQIRVHSVHKKQELFMPSEAQTQAIVLYTKDILAKLFKN